MATKKSTKKSTKKAPAVKKQPILAFVLALIAVVVACMMFLPAIKVGEDIVVSGVIATFGGEVTKTTTGTLGSVTLNIGETLFNVGLFFAFLLPVVLAVVYAVFELINAKLGRMLVILPTVAFIASAVLFFLGVKLFLGANGDETWVSLLVSAETEFKLGIGLILGGSLSVVGALASLYTCYVKLVK
ncbi:MAG: hypothetical protein ACI311_02215 [Bacilli bacterium]